MDYIKKETKKIKNKRITIVITQYQDICFDRNLHIYFSSLRRLFDPQLYTKVCIRVYLCMWYNQ